jgi:hypothetical protein
LMTLHAGLSSVVPWCRYRDGNVAHRTRTTHPLIANSLLHCEILRESYDEGRWTRRARVGFQECPVQQGEGCVPVLPLLFCGTRNNYYDKVSWKVGCCFWIVAAPFSFHRLCCFSFTSHPSVCFVLAIANTFQATRNSISILTGNNQRSSLNDKKSSWHALTQHYGFARRKRWLCGGIPWSKR